MKYVIHEVGNEDTTANVDINNGNEYYTAREAVEFALAHPKMWGNHEAGIEAEVDAAMERSNNETAEQSGDTSGTGGSEAEAEAKAEGSVVSGERSDNRQSDGRASVRRLSEFSREETRVAQTKEERTAEEVVSNITRGRTIIIIWNVLIPHLLEHRLIEVYVHSVFSLLRSKLYNYPAGSSSGGWKRSCSRYHHQCDLQCCRSQGQG